MSRSSPHSSPWSASRPGNLGNVEDTTWQTALDTGWSDAELTEASVHIALNLFTNHLNHLVQTDLDLPPAPGL
jgi:hypothetical protein